MSPSRDQLIDLILRETTDKVTADGVQIAAPNILEVGCRYVRGDPRRGYEKPAEAARQFAGFIADAVLALTPQSGGPPFDVEDYVADYEFRADGEGGSYSPNDNERALLIDAIHGAISEASLTPSAAAATPRKQVALPADEGGCVTNRFVIFTQPGMAPEKKGGWLQNGHLIEFLREVMLHYGWTPGFRATVLELTWDNDLWASSASEYLSIHDHAIGPRRARKAWQEAREKHERVYKAAPYMPLGQEIKAYSARTHPSPTPTADKTGIAVEKLKSIRAMRSDRPSGPYPKSYKGGFDAAADLMSGWATEAFTALEGK